jgi:hypothetical protein
LLLLASWDGCVVVTVAGLFPVAFVFAMGLVGIGAGAEAAEEQPANRKMGRITINIFRAIIFILHLNP